MTHSKNISNPSPECFGNADASVVEKRSKLHKEILLILKVPQNYFLIYF